MRCGVLFPNYARLVICPSNRHPTLSGTKRRRRRYLRSLKHRRFWHWTGTGHELCNYPTCDTASSL